VPAYVDSSALLKLYLPEIGSAWMRTDVRPGGITISALAIAEIGAALARRVWDRSMDDRGAKLTWRRFRRHLEQFHVTNVTRDVLIGARTLAVRSTVPLRALDAIQLQCAVEARRAGRARGVQIQSVIAADDRLLAAAQALGFATDNPLLHP
jgi:predicted nucleic acid-binding protein